MRLILFVVGLVLPTLGFGGDTVFNYPMTVQSQQQLDVLSKKMVQANVLRGDFKQIRVVKVLKRPLKSSGSFIFSKKHGLLWRIQKPFATDVLMHDGKLVQRTPGRPAQVIDAGDNPSARIMADVFSALFSQDKEMLDRYFNQFFLASESGWLLGLTPKNKALSRVVAQVILGGEDEISSIVIDERNGDRAEISLLSVQASMDESTVNDEFIFSP